MTNAFNTLRSACRSPIKLRKGAAGLHLFDRATGTNVLMDEVAFHPALWSKAPRQVSIALTNSCDLTCPHCYAPKNSAVLDVKRLAEWLIELDENGCIGVGFGGGEPCLHPELTKICAFAARETTLAATMTTHAHRLTDQLLDELSENLNFIRISMDGIGSTYESIRGRSFDGLIDRIEAIKKVVPFGINFVINALTIEDLSCATQIAAELGASEFLLLPEEPVNGSSGIDGTTLEAMQKWVMDYRGPVRLAVSESRADGLPTCDPLSAETGLAAFAHIDASGFLKRTSYDSVGVPIGAIGVMSAIDEILPK